MIKDNDTDINLDTKNSNKIINISEVFDIVKNGNLKSIQKFFSENAINPDEKNIYGQTLLIVAVVFKHIGVVKFLLEKYNFDVNAQDIYGLSSLHYAVKAENLEIVDILLKHPKIKLDIKDIFGRIPFDYAVIAENEKLTELLRVDYLL